MAKSEDELRAEGDRLLLENLPTESLAAFGTMHEMFLTLMASGFSKLEALWLTGYLITGGSRNLEEPT